MGKAVVAEIGGEKVRLIDADALKQGFESSDFDDDPFENVDNACRIVNQSPTIDAIPLEWLEQQRDKRRAAAAAHSNISSMTVLEAINVVLELWQKEQEVRGT